MERCYELLSFSFLYLNMDFVARIFFYIGCFAFLLLVVGLFKPWVALWWEDIQNRKKVIKLYGTVALFAFLTHFVLQLLHT